MACLPAVSLCCFAKKNWPLLACPRERTCSLCTRMFTGVGRNFSRNQESVKIIFVSANSWLLISQASIPNRHAGQQYRRHVCYSPRKVCTWWHQSVVRVQFREKFYGRASKFAFTCNCFPDEWPIRVLSVALAVADLYQTCNFLFATAIVQNSRSSCETVASHAHTWKWKQQQKPHQTQRA